MVEPGQDQHSANDSDVQAEVSSNDNQKNSAISRQEGGDIEFSSSTVAVPISISDSQQIPQSVYVARVNPDAIDALAHNNPEKFIAFLDDNDRRLTDFVTIKEKNRHNEANANEDTKRLALGVTILVFISILFYAGMTRDGAFAKEIMSSLFIGLGGIGIGKGFIKSNDKE